MGEKLKSSCVSAAGSVSAKPRITLGGYGFAGQPLLVIARYRPLPHGVDPVRHLTMGALPRLQRGGPFLPVARTLEFQRSRFLEGTTAHRSQLRDSKSPRESLIPIPCRRIIAARHHEHYPPPRESQGFSGRFLKLYTEGPSAFRPGECERFALAFQGVGPRRRHGRPPLSAPGRGQTAPWRRRQDSRDQVPGHEETPLRFALRGVSGGLVS